jgi:transposase
MCEIAPMDTLVDHDDAVAQLRGLLENAGDDRKRLLDAVSDLVVEVSRENAHLRSEVAELQHLRSEVAELRRLRSELAELRRRIFGRSREKVDPNQLRLAIEETQAEEHARQDAEKPAVDPDAPACPPEPAAKRSRKGQHPGRAPLPEHLPREERRHTLSEDERRCECCGGLKEAIREEATDRLDYRPASLRIVFDVIEVYACACGQSKPVAAEMPPRVIEGGLPEPGLLAHVAVSKYLDHVPLNRMSRIFEREGVTIPRNTLMGWIRSIAWTLQPLWERIDERVLRAWVVQSDDTGLDVLDKQKKGGSRRGRIWANVGDGRFVAYHYSPDWKHEHPARFLEGRVGYLQTDGYKGYDALCVDHGGLAIRVGCFMHARRYFVKAFEAGELAAARPIELIRDLYAIERASKDAGEDADARWHRRKEHSEPLLEALAAWKKEHAGRFPPKSKMGKALTYLEGHWDALRAFMLDGHLEIDNGAAERALRGIAVGRRNWLFAGSDAGAERAVIIYSVIESAKLHGIEPFEYLRDVLDKLGSGWPMRQLDELMPDRWAAAHGIEPPPSRLTALRDCA